MKVLIKTAVLIIIIELFFSTIIYADSEPSPWAVGEVNELIEKKILDESFFVDYQSFINRKDVAYLSVRVYEVLTGKVAKIGDNPFVDTDDAWVLKGYNLGILKGYGNGFYGPDDLITREQLATLLIRMLIAADVMVDDEVVVIEFADNGEISEGANEFVYIAYKNQIVTGVAENRMAPKMNATREQSMLMANRIIDKFEEDTVNLGAAQIQGDWIYQTPVTPDDTKAIFKTKTDGSERIKLCDDSFLSSLSGVGPLLDGDWFYYVSVDDKFCLYRVKTEGSVRERVSEGPVSTDFCIKDEQIDYTVYDNDIIHIVKMKKDGSESNLILEDVTVASIRLQDISDDYIFFSSDSGNSLKKSELNGSDINDINIDGIWLMEAKDDCIYYVTFTDDQDFMSEIYSAKHDGSGIERLTNNNAVLMEVIDE